MWLQWRNFHYAGTILERGMPLVGLQDTPIILSILAMLETGVNHLNFARLTRLFNGYPINKELEDPTLIRWSKSNPFNRTE